MDIVEKLPGLCKVWERTITCKGESYEPTAVNPGQMALDDDGRIWRRFTAVFPDGRSSTLWMLVSDPALSIRVAKLEAENKILKELIVEISRAILTKDPAVIITLENKLSQIDTVGPE